MARGVNRVTLVGNLGADPEVRYANTGIPIANIRIATSSAYKNKTTGELVETTEWHRVVFFNRLAEIARDYLRKGSKVYIEGSLKTRKWEDKNKIELYTTEIIAHELQMLDAKRAGSEQLEEEHADDYAHLSSSSIPEGQSPHQPTFDDDIPF